MKLDREYQLELLNRLYESAPTYLDFIDFMNELSESDEEKYAANMIYLEGHGLLHSAIQFGTDRSISFGLPEITSKGTDFIADDGGLSAILGVVTVKFHEDTIKSLIEFHVDKSDLSQPDKNELIAQLKRLPGESIAHLTKKLVEMGLQNVHQLPQLIQTLAQSF